MVNIGFHCGGIGAQLLSSDDGRLFGLLHDPLMYLLSAFLAKEIPKTRKVRQDFERHLRDFPA